MTLGSAKHVQLQAPPATEIVDLPCFMWFSFEGGRILTDPLSVVPLSGLLSSCTSLSRRLSRSKSMSKAAFRLYMNHSAPSSFMEVRQGSLESSAECITDFSCLQCSLMTKTSNGPLRKSSSCLTLQSQYLQVMEPMTMLMLWFSPTYLTSRKSSLPPKGENCALPISTHTLKRRQRIVRSISDSMLAKSRPK